MSSPSAWLGALAVHQDYVWFIASLGWLAVGALAIRAVRPGTAVCPVWVWTLVGSGILLAALEVALQSAPRPDPHAPRANWDVALAATSVVSAGGFLWSAFARVTSRDWRAGLRGGGIVIFATILWTRWSWPASSAWAVAIMQAGAIGGILAPRVGALGASGPVLTKGLGIYLMCLPLLSAHGPIAELTQHAVRWSDLTYFGAAAAASHVVAAVWVGRHLWVVLLEPGKRPVAPRDRREISWLVAMLALWLAAGLGLTHWSGATAGADYEAALRRRARTAAAVLEVDELEACAGPKLKVQRTIVVKQEEGWNHLIGVAPHLQDVSFLAPQSRLSRIQKANPDARYVHIATLRHGYLTSFIFPSDAPGAGDKVSLLTPATTTDLQWWIEKSEAVEGPMRTTLGPLLRVREPLVTSRGQMLGWLLLDFGVPDWVANRAHARRQMFAVVGLGAALALLILLHRLKQSERDEARRAAEAAADADRLKTEFLAKVSHELRTPIQSVLGYGELLNTLPLAEEPKRWLGALRNHGEIMVRLVNDLLDLSTLQTGKFRLTRGPVELTALCREIVDDFSPRAAAKGLVLVGTSSQSEACWVTSDAARLRQILVNLVGNAIKYTRQGQISLQLNLEKGTGHHTVIARFDVTDTGPGIPARDHERIFDAFMRLEKAVSEEGAGIGLALAKALAVGLGGNLTVESDGISGTAFSLTLPIESAQPPWQKAPAMPSLNGLRVLVADDNTLIRELYLVHLRRSGARAEAVSDGLAVIERFLHEPFDVVVMDVQMPGLDGIAAARRLRYHASQTARQVRIVGVSAGGTFENRPAALAAGMDILLSKPVALQTLSNAVVGAPDDTAPESSHTGDLERVLRERLARQFRQELPKLLSDIIAGASAGDWATLRARVHYLKNGADILRYEATRAACVALDTVAAAKSHSELTPQLAILRTVVQRETERESFQPDPPADPTNN